MPLRKRGRISRKPTTRRVKRRMTYRPRLSRSMTANANVHHFKRWYAPAGIAGAVGFAPWVGAFTVALSNVPGASEFASLYDQYRLNFCVLKAYLKIDPSAQTAAGASYPRMFWCRDYDDATVPSNLDELRERNGTKVAVMHPNRPVVIKFKPNVLQLIYQSAVANQFKPAFKQWLDMGTNSTTHYGIKCAIDDLTNTNYRVNFEVELYFSCKNQR